MLSKKQAKLKHGSIFCLACKYIDTETFERLDQEYEKILGMLNSMEMKADKFCFQPVE
jgi:hypothetical protein